jgi:hypothetical protein
MVETSRAPITTILFTDLVDSTTLMQRVGDERAQKLFETHQRRLWFVGFAPASRRPSVPAPGEAVCGDE